MAIFGTITATLLSCICISTFTKPSASVKSITLQIVVQAVCATTVLFLSRSFDNRFVGVRAQLQVLQDKIGSCGDSFTNVDLDLLNAQYDLLEGKSKDLQNDSMDILYSLGGLFIALLLFFLTSELCPFAFDAESYAKEHEDEVKADQQREFEAYAESFSIDEKNELFLIAETEKDNTYINDRSWKQLKVLKRNNPVAYQEFRSGLGGEDLATL